MVITYIDFKKGNFNERASKNRKKHPIYLFLKKNKNNAYKVKEICKIIKMKEDNVRCMLRVLIGMKLVEHKIPFFAFKR